MPNTDVVISVIIPAYNHEKYVAKAIGSVLAQEGVSFELIVIDDGSTDRTAAIARELSEKHRFHFISRPNRGLIPTLQEGIACARGEYIAMVASDDYFLPGRLITAVAAFQCENPAVQAIAGRAIVVDSADNIVANYESYVSEPLWPRDCYRELIVANWIPALATTYRRSFLSSLKFPSGLRIEDWFMLLCAARSGGLRLATMRLSAYRKHHGNSIRTWGAEYYKQQILLLSEQFEEMRDYQDLKRRARRHEVWKTIGSVIRQRSLIAALLLRKIRDTLTRKPLGHE